MNITSTSIKPRTEAVYNEPSQRRQYIAIALIALLLSALSAFVSGIMVAKSELRKGYEDKISKLSLDKETAVNQAYLQGKDEGIAFAKAEQEKLSDKPFMPVTALSKKQESLCLALAVYSEARGELPIHREVVAWSVVNRAIDERESSIFKNSVCAVVVARSQYDAMKPYINAVNKVVWGDNLNYVPHSASDPKTDDGKAWLDVYKLASEIMNGKRSRKTLANHFYSPSAAGNNNYPEFLKYMKLLAPAGKHIMAVDYTVKDGKVIHFTRENPYNPKIHG